MWITDSRTHDTRFGESIPIDPVAAGDPDEKIARVEERDVVATFIFKYHKLGDLLPL